MNWTCKYLHWHAPRSRTLPGGGIEKRCIECGLLYWVAEPGQPRRVGVLGGRQKGGPA